MNEVPRLDCRSVVSPMPIPWRTSAQVAEVRVAGRTSPPNEIRRNIADEGVRKAAAQARLNSIRRRIATGTYFTPDKIDHVVDELFDVLQREPASGAAAVA